MGPIPFVLRLSKHEWRRCTSIRPSTTSGRAEYRPGRYQTAPASHNGPTMSRLFHLGSQLSAKVLHGAWCRLQKLDHHPMRIPRVHHRLLAAVLIGVLADHPASAAPDPFDDRIHVVHLHPD